MTPLRRPTRKGYPETLVALVDVVFFLLVFALLIGRMDATAPFRIDPPHAASGTDMPGGGMTLTVSADAEFALDGRSIVIDGLLEGVATRLVRDPETRVRVNADGALELRHILPLVDDITRLGARDVVLVVTPGN